MSEQQIEVKTDRWQAEATKLAKEVPHYRNNKPNWHHLVNAAATGPYTEIDDENIDDVIAFLRARVEPEHDHDAPMLPEAPASWNLTYYIHGRREQITLRGMTYAQIAIQAKAARAWISEHADEPYIPNGHGNGAQPKQAEKTFSTPIGSQADGLSDMPEPEYSDIEDDGGLSFKPETLSANVTDGKVFWRVKGERWSKFGITIWPEVLKAANLTNLDPDKQYSLSNFKSAIYINNDKGNPSKVTALV